MAVVSTRDGSRTSARSAQPWRQWRMECGASPIAQPAATMALFGRPRRAYTLACAQVRLVRGQWLLDWQRVVAVRCAWGLAAAALAAGHACLVVRGARIGMNLCYTARRKRVRDAISFCPLRVRADLIFPRARSRCCEAARQRRWAGLQTTLNAARRARAVGCRLPRANNRLLQ